MAKYKVLGFSSVIKNNANGAPNLFIDCTLENSAGNEAKREYRIWSDTRFPNIQVLMQQITAGFNQAMAVGSRVEITEDKPRFYLHLILPGANNGQSMQLSGVRL